MAVSQDTARHQGRVFQLAHAKSEVDALSDLVNDSFGDKDLDVDVRIFLLESDDNRREQ